MIIGRINTVAMETFSIIDADNLPVEGLPSSDFSYGIFGPNGDNVTLTHPITIEELGDGHYRVSFMPKEEGLYYLIVKHNLYFPAGKGGHFQIFSDDFSSVGTMVSLIKDFTEGRWRIDKNTNQMIFYRGDNTTEIARFNLYDSAGNPTIENVFDRQKV